MLTFGGRGGAPRHAETAAARPAGALHHVMGRGIDGTQVCQNDTDRDEFVSRLAALGGDGPLGV